MDRVESVLAVYERILMPPHAIQACGITFWAVLAMIISKTMPNVFKTHAEAQRLLIGGVETCAYGVVKSATSAVH